MADNILKLLNPKGVSDMRCWHTLISRREGSSKKEQQISRAIMSSPPEMASSVPSWV